jgi:hypothetical protein
VTQSGRSRRRLLGLDRFGVACVGDGRWRRARIAVLGGLQVARIQRLDPGACASEGTNMMVETRR